MADSAVLWAVNRGALQEPDFVFGETAVLLGPAGRRSLVEAFEQRMGRTFSHPLFVRPIAYREWLFAQARLLSDYLTGARGDFPQVLP